MKAFVYHGQRDGRLEEVPTPVPGPGQVKLRITDAGICQTQIDEFMEGPYIINRAPHPLTGKALPLIPGHEVGGIVEQLGPGVDTRWLGKQVGFLPAKTCGDCRFCRAGEIALCDQLAYFGLLGGDGGFAEYMVCDTNMIFECSRRELLSYVEPLACSIHQGNKIKRFGRSNNVLILGAGALGVSAAAVFSKHFGFEVTITDPLPNRLERCAKAGFITASREQLRDRRFDVVVELAGSNHTNTEGAFIEAFDYLHKGGSLFLVGTYFHPLKLVPMASLIVPEKNVIPCFAYHQEDVDQLSAAMDAIKDIDFEIFNDYLPFEKILDEGYFRAEVDKDSFTRLVLRFE
ncbi:MAG: zinc-dependent alcohol dehydrogenase [Myxococcota bacterium]